MNQQKRIELYLDGVDEFISLLLSYKVVNYTTPSYSYTASSDVDYFGELDIEWNILECDGVAVDDEEMFLSIMQPSCSFCFEQKVDETLKTCLTKELMRGKIKMLIND